MTKSNYRNFTTMLLSAVSLVSLVTAAQAAEVASAQSSGLEEIVVTAERRAVSIQEVPASITAFDKTSIEKLGIKSVSDLPRLTPGFTYRTTGTGLDTTFIIRGIGMNNGETNQNPAVGVYIDEISMPSIAMLGFQLFDLERIEVLKGPQGTLYGRNTTGGAVNIYTAQPTQEFTAHARLDVGSLNLKEMEGAISGAITDTLSMRIAGNSYSRNGWQTVLVGPTLAPQRNGDIDRKSGRLSALWKPSSVFDALLVGDYTSENSQPLAYQSYGNLKTDGSRTFCSYPTTGIPDPTNCGSYAIPRAYVGAPIPGTLAIFSNTNPDPRTTYASFPYGNHNKIRTGGFSLKMNAHLDRITLTSVTGYRAYKRNLTTTDGSPFDLSAAIRDQHLSAFSEEFRASSDDSWGAVKWIVGGYYTRDTDRENTLFNQRDQYSYSAEFTSSYDQVAKSYAGFAQADWKLMDSLTLTTGGRYTHEEKNFFYDGSVYGSGGFPTPVHNYNNNISDNKATWRVALKYDVSSDANVYASVSTGFKGGGFPATIAFSTGQLTPFKSETITAYEAGFKSEWLNHTLRFNAAGYYYNWKDFQATTQINVNNVPLVILADAGDAHIKGVEAEATWYPVPSLSTQVGVNWIDAKIINGLYKNQIPPITSKFMLNGMTRWEPAQGFGRLHPFVQADYSYASSYYDSLANSLPVQEPSLWIVNAKAGVKFEKGFEISVWVKNLTDNLYRTDVLGAGSASLPARTIYGDPRTWGVSLNYNY